MSDYSSPIEQHEDRRLRDLYELLDRERRARRKLAAISAAKDVFLAMLAEETRVTLDCIAQWMRMLSGEHLDARTREVAFAAIERAAKRELELLDDVIDVGDADGDTAQLALAEVDVDGVLGTAIDMVSRHDDGVRIESTGVGEDAALVIGDRHKLERAFERLLTAAVRCARHGEAVRVGLRRQARSWTVQVEHPVRADSWIDQTAECCMQLAIARAIVKAHGGTFDVSVDEEASVRRFVANLPAFMSAEDVARQPLEGVGVLIVDDDRDTRMLVAEIVHRHGASAFAAADARVAAAAIQTFRANVILTAVDIDVVRSAAASVPVIHLARNTRDPLVECPDRVLDLPFTSPRVVAAIADALTEVRARAAL